jgi:predicted ATP-grasp superfamily ATP-dependent carboligase
LSGRSVLIAALSGRALAAAARRAGLTPLVVDAFGDVDTRENAGAYRRLPAATRRGFRAHELCAALEGLAEQSERPPLGLLLGSGFEDTPRLVATLARRFALLGNSGDTIKQAKAPGAFFPLLDRLAIAHPETLLTAPVNAAGWLSKRIGGSGGAHVISCVQARTTRGRYFQRRVDGAPVSILVLAGEREFRIVGFSRQWTVGYGDRPYRYGGAAGPAELHPGVEERLASAAEAVCAELRLAGLVSFDFLLQDDKPLLLEVNPRPGATLDVFDDAKGSLLVAHIAACQGRISPLPDPGATARASGILYADDLPAGRAALTIGAVSWPDWTADRPAKGTRIPSGRPVATVTATGETATTAEYNCRRRLDELARMLYGRAADTEHDNAEIHRPRPQRIGESGQAH